VVRLAVPSARHNHKTKTQNSMKNHRNGTREQTPKTTAAIAAAPALAPEQNGKAKAPKAKQEPAAKVEQDEAPL